MEHTTSNAHSTFQPPSTASQQVQQPLRGVLWHSGMSPYSYTLCAFHKAVRKCYGCSSCVRSNSVDFIDFFMLMSPNPEAKIAALNPNGVTSSLDPSPPLTPMTSSLDPNPL